MAGGMGELIMTKRLKNVFYGLFAAALTVSLGVLAAVNLPVRAQENAGTFAMETGAEIRLEEPSGLRFITKVDQAFIDGLEEANPEAEITFGTEIVPAGREDVEPLDIPQTVWAEESTETVKCFKAVLTNIPDTQYLTKLTAKAYYAVDGVKTYVSNPQTRSVAYVASAALAAGQEDPVYTAIVDKAVPAISLGEDFSLNVGGEKTLAAEGAEGLVVKFSSDNDEIATVDENGVVRAVGTGTANITAALGSRTDSVAVTVAAAAKKLAYDFEDGTVGAAYAPELFAANVAGSGHNITVADVEGNKVLAYDFDGAADGFPNIIIKNEVVRALYETVGSMSFTLTNKGAKFHEGYYTLPSGTHRYDLFSGDSVTIVVPEEHMKELVDNGKDLVYIVNNDGTSPSYENARFTYYLDNVGAPSLDKIVEKGGTLSAAELLGKNATLKSFAVYKDNALVSEEGAESYTFAESGVYSVEYVQSFAGYEDVAIKGTVRVLDVVFDSVEEFYGADKLIVSTHEMNEPTVAEYKGVNALRFASNGGYPRLHLNKGMFEEITAEGKTFTLWFYFSEIEGAHSVYLGQKKGYVYDYVSDNLGELVITPEIYESTKTDAEFAENIPITVNAYTDGTNVYDPYVLHLLGYSLS